MCCVKVVMLQKCYTSNVPVDAFLLKLDLLVLQLPHILNGNKEINVKMNMNRRRKNCR